MNKKFLYAYLAVSTLFCGGVIFSMPVSDKTIIFCGMFVINIFLFLDAQKKD